MLWLVGQIIVFLIIAACIGFILGWLWRGWFPGGAHGEASEQAALEAAHAEAAALGQKKAAAQVKRQFAATKSSTPDDLKQIKGIGPKLEGLLHSINVTTFDQVAEFTPRDVAMVTAALDSFKDRIIRDDWVGQAKTIAKTRRSD